MRLTAGAVRDQIYDLIFPVVCPLSYSQLKREVRILRDQKRDCAARVGAIPDAEEDNLVAYLGECSKLHDEENDRRQGVESRLTSISGLSSIAGTILFSGILAQAAGTMQPPTRLIGLAIAAGALYIALQVCSAILAAVRGLQRRAYDTEMAGGVLPAPTETRPAHLKNRINASVRRLGRNRIRNNEKVGQMAAAHRAMKNFLGGLIFMAVLGTVVAARNPSDNLTQKLRDNRELNELLRGPQGPKGDPGPPGPRGESAQPLPATAQKPHPIKSTTDCK